MAEHTKFQHVPLKVYRSEDHLTIAAPLPGLEPEDILVQVTEKGELIIHGDVRATLKGIKEVLLNEWDVGGYHREFTLPESVDGEHANVTYGNGVLVISFLASSETRPARITLEKTGTDRGEYRGNIGGHLHS